MNLRGAPGVQILSADTAFWIQPSAAGTAKVDGPGSASITVKDQSVPWNPAPNQWIEIQTPVPGTPDYQAAATADRKL